MGRWSMSLCAWQEYFIKYSRLELKDEVLYILHHHNHTVHLMFHLKHTLTAGGTMQVQFRDTGTSERTYEAME